MARITILDAATSRSDVSNRTGKPYTIISQPAMIETAALKQHFDLDLPSLDAQKPKGSAWDWNPEADLRPGRYGPEFARYKTLTAAK